MATNFVQEGDILELAAPSGGTVTGVPELIGGILFVPLTTEAVGVRGNMRCTGVFTLAKTSAQAWTEGQKIYWDDGNSRCDSDSTVGPLIGIATRVEANPTATGRVRLNGTATALAEGAQAAIVTLTDSTGDSGTHNDALADGLTATAPSAITNYDAVTNMTDPVAVAEGEAVSLALSVLEDEVTLLQVTVAACVTDLTVQNQNDSDSAQKIIQILAALVAGGFIDA